MKMKDSKKHPIRKAEHEYLKKLEESITGKSSDNFYIIPPEDIKKQKQLELLRRVYDKPAEISLPEKEDEKDKEPSRISIEAIVGVEQETQETQKPQETLEPKESPQVKEQLFTPSVPIEYVINDIEPAPQESAPTLQEISSAPQETSLQPPRISRPAPSVSPKPETEPPSPQPTPLFDMGTIILLEDGSLGIYKGPIPGKEYHLIYHLRPEGSVTPEGIYLYAYRSETLGCVSSEALEEMQRSMRWERDQILDPLSPQEKARLIPLLSSRAIKKEMTEPLRKRNSLERGRLLKVKIGDKIWEAIYWGSDELGQIVAHNTNKVWTLMHLNLGRFGDALQYGDILSPEQIKNINLSLTESLSVGD